MQLTVNIPTFKKKFLNTKYNFFCNLVADVECGSDENSFKNHPLAGKIIGPNATENYRRFPW